MNDIVMEVNNPKEYLTALTLARNAFLSNVSICVNNKNKTFSESIANDIQDGINGVFSSTSGFFPAAQTRSYSSRIIFNPLGFGANVHLNARYMCSEKERNDFICIAAEISELLNRNCGINASDFVKVKAFADWVRRYFTYKNNDVYQDHSAAELLKNRTGVCQAIAALACVVLPYMGLRVQYVIGQGKGVSGWGNHAWNMVFMEGRWIHVDFTFSMNSFGIPMTNGRVNTRLFLCNHRWNENAFLDSAIAAKYRLNSSMLDAEIILYLNNEYFEIDGVRIYSGKPVFYEKDNVTWIKYHELVKYLGGGCEYNTNLNEFQICVANKRFSIKNAANVIDMDSAGVRKESLEALGIKYIETNRKLIFRF